MRSARHGDLLSSTGENMDNSEGRFGDITDEFEFDENSMDYLDGPLSGWLRSKSTGAWFAFDCQPIIDGRLWHWTLVPEKERTDAGCVLEEAANRSTGYWLSIVEDRRSSRRSESRLVRIDNATARPVLLSARARSPRQN